MNAFGRIFRIMIFGESHGDSVGIVMSGCPAGLSLSERDFLGDLERRKGGNAGTTGRVEKDSPIIKSGVFDGKTTGAPITIEFENEGARPGDYLALKDTPRPGHADLSARIKYGGFNDYRGGGHFSGRLTVALVASGVVAKKILKKKGIRIKAHVSEAGGKKRGAMYGAIEDARKAGDSLGGIVECRVVGLPVGLGEPFFNSVESLLAHAAFSIPSVKGIEFGIGFPCSGMRGSQYNDEITDFRGKTRTNNAGGINGGMTNGNEVTFRIAIRPASSIARKMKTINLATGKKTEISVSGRHDACIALRVPVILEAMTAVVFADFMLLEQKIGRILNE